MAARFLSDPAHGEAHGEVDDANFPGEDDLKLLFIIHYHWKNNDVLDHKDEDVIDCLSSMTKTSLFYIDGKNELHDEDDNGDDVRDNGNDGDDRCR